MLRFLTSWLRNFADSLAMSCKDAEQIHSRCCDGAAEPGQKPGLCIHLLYCKGCRVYARQIDLLRRTAARLRAAPSQEPAASSTPMPEDVANRLRERLGSR